MHARLPNTEAPILWCARAPRDELEPCFPNFRISACIQAHVPYVTYDPLQCSTPWVSASMRQTTPLPFFPSFVRLLQKRGLGSSSAPRRCAQLAVENGSASDSLLLLLSPPIPRCLSGALPLRKTARTIIERAEDTTMRSAATCTKTASARACGSNITRWDVYAIHM